MGNYVTVHTTTVLATYNDDILPYMLDAIASLADLEVEFDLRCSALDQLAVTGIVRQRLRQRLDRVRTHARQPHVSLLADLHQRMTFSTMFLRSPGTHQAMEASQWT
jgi:hypothetical protein